MRLPRAETRICPLATGDEPVLDGLNVFVETTIRYPETTSPRVEDHPRARSSLYPSAEPTEDTRVDYNLRPRALTIGVEPRRERIFRRTIQAEFSAKAAPERRS